ncbi:MAG: ABC transporter ATP-binding protein [Clostridia bacterium]|nr:ABC transporter ATP-binding protein [Clostridia bacterium]
MALLSVKNVNYTYKGGRPVLRGVNLELEKGKVYCIFGPSGCGKTTLLSLMGGLDVPTEGTIEFEGEDIAKIGLANHRKHNAAYVFQNYNLVDYMTAAENVQLVTKENPYPYLRKVGIKREEIRRQVLKLSGGQQQRVAIARALASGAPLILADEPTGNLDEDTAEEIVALLKENAYEDNRCIVIVSHSTAVAEQADVVLRLSHGVLQQM